MLVLCLSEDRGFVRQCPDVPVTPEAARGILAEIVDNDSPTWVLHREQVVDLQVILSGLIARSLQVLNQQTKRLPPLSILTEDELQNAQEFLAYLEGLDAELITHPDRKDILFGAPGCPEADPANQLANSLRPEVNANEGHDEYRATIFCCFALTNTRQVNGLSTILHCDRRWHRIQAIVEAHISRLLRQPAPQGDTHLPEPQRILSTHPGKGKKRTSLRIPRWVNAATHYFQPKASASPK